MLSQQSGALSSNYLSRKNENERILTENLKLFQKLSQATGSVNMRANDKSFQTHKKYLTTITKAPLIQQAIRVTSPDYRPPTAVARVFSQTSLHKKLSNVSENQ